MLNKNYHWGTFLFFLVSLYLVSCWWSWWFGGGFGYRALIQTFAFLAFPMAAFYEAVLPLSGKSRSLIIRRYLLPAILSILCINNLVRHYQYKIRLLHWDSMSREAFLYSGWKMSGSAEERKYLESVYVHPDYEKAKQGIRWIDFMSTDNKKF